MPSYDGVPETVAESINHYTVKLTSVGQVYVEGTVAVPVNGLILRAKAVVTAGTAVNQVGVSIGEVAMTGPPGVEEVYSWPLAREPLDSRFRDNGTTGAPLFYAVAVDTTIDQSRGQKGLLFIYGKVDNDTLDHNVTIQVDIQTVE
jgi:hypothetical protein